MYYLSECLIIKNENRYLPEHLRYGLQAGIEHFFIYDNLSEEPVIDYLKQYAPELLDVCTIERYDKVADAPRINIQVDCYRIFCHNHGHETKWCTFTDVDELYTGSLRKACEEAENEGYKSLCIKQTVYGANGRAYETDGGLFERFGDDPIKYDMVKVCIQTEWIAIQLAHHTVFYTNDPMNVKRIASDNDIVRLHHFMFRSFEEYVKKKLRGSMQYSLRYSLSYFYTFNKIPIEDKNAILNKYGFDKSH